VGIIRLDTGAVAGYDDRIANLPGYTAGACNLIRAANQTNRVVTWGGKSDVSALAGKPVRLRFQWRDCDLYTFPFRR